MRIDPLVHGSSLISAKICPSEDRLFLRGTINHPPSSIHPSTDISDQMLVDAPLESSLNLDEDSMFKRFLKLDSRDTTSDTVNPSKLAVLEGGVSVLDRRQAAAPRISVIRYRLMQRWKAR